MTAKPEMAPQQLPPDAQLLGIVTSAWVSAAVYVTAKLGIADLLADGPKTVEYLAVATATDEHSLYRILRAVASTGVFTEVQDRKFENTPMSDTMRTDHPASIRDLVIWANEPEHWKVYGELMHSVKTGKPAWDKYHGEPVFPYLFKTNPELGAIFNRAMTSLSHQASAPLLDVYDFSKAGVIADIAGGLGHLLGAVLEAYPNARGVLFDLPEVLDGAPEMLSKYGVLDRVEMMIGNFMSDVPVVADVYLLKHIIHDWYDETNQMILGNIRKHMTEGAKVLIIETVVPDGNDPHFSKIIDIEMLAAPGGMERTAAEFETLLNDSGFRLARIIPTCGPMSIIEAEKA
jgi:hypothetical protein